MITLDDIEISPYLLWVDEIWSPVVGSSEFGVEGALFIDASAKKAGRPITLTAPANQGWITRATLLALLKLAEVPGRKMKLTLTDGREFTVVFRHQGGLPIEAAPVVGVSVPSDEDYYNITLKFTEVKENP